MRKFVWDPCTVREKGGGGGIRSLWRCLWPVLRTYLLAVASIRDLTYWPQQARNCSVYSEWNCFRTVIMPTTKGALSIWSVGRLATIVPERRIHQELADLDEENHEKISVVLRNPPPIPLPLAFKEVNCPNGRLNTQTWKRGVPIDHCTVVY